MDAADRASFFEIEEFAVNAFLDGASEPIRVIFDSPYFEPLGVASAGPAVTCQSVDVAAATQASTLEIDGVIYRVQTIEPDGTGMTLLRLALV